MQWIKDYLISTTHKWWVENIWRPSWTRVVTFIYGVPALVTSVFVQLAAWGNDSSVAAYMDRMHVPNWVPMAFAGVALVSYIAHGRKAGDVT